MADSEDSKETERKRIVLAMKKALPESNLDFNNLIKTTNIGFELDTSSCPNMSIEEQCKLLALVTFIVNDWPYSIG